MEAVLFNPKDKAVTLTTIDIPLIVEPDDVIVKVAYAGICSTDIQITKGAFPCLQRTVILGHEFSGIVYDVGTKVKRIKKGDKVGVDPISGCGTCRFCHSGNYHVCTDGGFSSYIGFFHNGGWAQYCRVSVKQVHLLPPRLTLKQGILCEPLSTICHCYDKMRPLTVGCRILVNGANTNGRLWCCMLRHLGHRKVFVSEVDINKQKQFEKIELGFTIGSPSEIEELFRNEGGADVCLECTGNPADFERLIGLMNKGGKLGMFSTLPENCKISISPLIVMLKELTILGVTASHFSYQNAVQIMEGMGSRYMNYELLGIEIFSMNQYKEALHLVESREVEKAVFSINGENDGPDIQSN